MPDASGTPIDENGDMVADTPSPFPISYDVSPGVVVIGGKRFTPRPGMTLEEAVDAGHVVVEDGGPGGE